VERALETVNLVNPNPTPRHENLTPWKPGQSGNTGGRPRCPLTAMLRKILAEVDPKTNRTYGELVVRALIRGAIQGKPEATRQLWNRVAGKVPSRARVPAGAMTVRWPEDDDGSDTEGVPARPTRNGARSG
jgi:hypothetical protein